MNYSAHSDHELTILLKKGDEFAFAEIYQRYKWVLYLHAVKRMSNREDAKDIIQELFTNLWDPRNDIDLHSHLSGYLYTSVRNRIINWLSHEQLVDNYVNSLARVINLKRAVNSSAESKL